MDVLTNKVTHSIGRSEISRLQNRKPYKMEVTVINIPAEVVKDKSITKGLMGCFPFIASSIFLHASLYYKDNLVEGHSWFHFNNQILVWVAVSLWALGVMAICLYVCHSVSMVNRGSFHSLVPIALSVLVGTLCTVVDVYILWFYNVL
tara:strand:- start:1238 stop:1681 length:444 start_codon:yes stop_codon:yes gene_type:complete